MRTRIKLSEVINFNPKENIKKGATIKKIPMSLLQENNRKLKGHEQGVYTGGAKFRNHDTLLAKISPCLENGKTAYVDILDEDEIASGSTEFIVLRNSVRITPLFIYYLVRSPKFRNKAISCMEGTSGRKRVNENTLKNYEIDLPSLEEQENISKILSELDNKIELNEKINNLLENLAKTIYDYWFVQFDFPDENGKPYKSSGGKMVWNDDLQKEIPEGWEVKKLNSLLNKNKTKFNIKENTDTIDLSVMPSNTFCLTNKNSSLNFKTNLFLLNKYDLLFGSIRPYLLKAGFSPFNGAVNGTVHSFKPKEEKYFNFLLVTITHKNMFDYAIARSKGTRMPVISDTDILDFNVPFNTEIVQKFNEIAFKEIIANNITQNFELEKLRDWLLPMLMNGQVTIND